MGRKKLDNIIKYDSLELSRLVKEAVGDGTINDLCLRSGLGTSIIGRFINCRLLSNPKESTLIKIAQASQGRVRVNDILKAGGYEERNDIQDEPTDNIDSEIITEIKYKHNCINTINGHMSEIKGRNHRTVNYGSGRIYDYTIEIEENIDLKSEDRGPDDYSRGTMYFKILFDDTNNKQIAKRKLIKLYGELIFHEFSRYNTYVVVTNNSHFFSVAKEFSPLYFPFIIQVILTTEDGLVFLDNYAANSVETTSLDAEEYNEYYDLYQFFRKRNYITKDNVAIIK